MVDLAVTERRIWARGSHVYDGQSNTIDWIILATAEVSVLLPVVALAPVFVALCQLLVLGERSAGFIPSYRLPVLRFAGLLIGLAALYLLPFIMLAIGSWMTRPLTDLIVVPIGLGVAHAAGLFVVALASSRLPSLAIDPSQLGAKGDWPRRGKTVRLFLALVLKSIPFFLIFAGTTAVLYIPVFANLTSDSAILGREIIAAMYAGVPLFVLFFWLWGMVAIACIVRSQFPIGQSLEDLQSSD